MVLRAKKAIFGGFALALAAVFAAAAIFIAVFAAVLVAAPAANSSVSAQGVVTRYDWPDQNCIQEISVGDMARGLNGSWSSVCRSPSWGPGVGSQGYRAQFYEINVPSELGDRVLTVELSSLAGTRITLYETNWVQIRYSADPEAPAPERIWPRETDFRIALERGRTYYLELARCDSCEPTVPNVEYQVEISLTSTRETRCITDGRVGQTVRVSPDASCIGVIRRQGREQYATLAVTLPADALVAFEVDRAAGLDVQLVDPDFHVLARADNGRSTDRFLYQTDQGGIFSFDIFGGQPARDIMVQISQYGRDLRGTFEPLIGGVAVSEAGIRCTLGFPVQLSNPADAGPIAGVVVNSHCSNQQAVVDYSIISQGNREITRETRATFSSDGTGGGVISIGELLDPAFYSSSDTPTERFNDEYDRLQCGDQCHYSDAAFFELVERAEYEPRIARPERRNLLSAAQFGQRYENSFESFARDYLTIDPDAPYFTIVGTAVPAEGDVVHKVGSTTGWTTGRVEDSCVTQYVDGPAGRSQLICQLRAESRGGNILSGSGDSGSPVFVCREREDFECRSGQVLLVGVLHSVTTEGTTESGTNYGTDFGVSPLGSVFGEFDKKLGREACWTFTSSGDCGEFSQSAANQRCPIAPARFGNLASGSWDRVCVATGGEKTYAQYYAITTTAGTLEIIVEAATDAEYEINLLNGNDYVTYGDALTRSAYNSALVYAPDAPPGAPRGVEPGRYIVEIASDEAPADYRVLIRTSDNPSLAELLPEPPPPPMEEPVVEGPGFLATVTDFVTANIYFVIGGAALLVLAVVVLGAVYFVRKE